MGNFMKTWRKNSKTLEAWTPFDFLRGVENALTPEPQMQTQERNHERRAEDRAKDAPHINWENLIDKMGKAMKGKVRVINGIEVSSDQERKDMLLEHLETHIADRQQALTNELMSWRNGIVENWKNELLARDRE